jgi:hypothetical protein
MFQIEFGVWIESLIGNRGNFHRETSENLLNPFGV